jgi:hypothetical protein
MEVRQVIFDPLAPVNLSRHGISEMLDGRLAQSAWRADTMSLLAAVPLHPALIQIATAGAVLHHRFMDTVQRATAALSGGSTLWSDFGAPIWPD